MSRTEKQAMEMDCTLVAGSDCSFISYINTVHPLLQVRNMRLFILITGIYSIWMERPGPVSSVAPVRFAFIGLPHMPLDYVSPTGNGRTDYCFLGTTWAPYMGPSQSLVFYTSMCIGLLDEERGSASEGGSRFINVIWNRIWHRAELPSAVLDCELYVSRARICSSCICFAPYSY
jgi:hypothetical protein